AVSPDGKTLAMSARGNASGQWWRHGHSHLDEAEIWLRDLTAPDSPSAYRGLTSGGAKDLWPMWSADGTSLFFVSDRDGAENLWQMPTMAPSAPRKVTHFTDGRVLWPSASARGDTIVFERDFRIWKADAASGKASEIPIVRMGAPSGPATEHLRLTAPFQDLALSPDGKKVAFSARGEIFAASAKDGGDAARVTMTAAPESEVAWSPDSKTIVYSSERSASSLDAAGPARLYSYDFTSGKETQLTSSGDGDYVPRFSPDGKSIAFVRGGTELHVTGVDGKGDRTLAKGLIADPLQVGHPLAWSPDGRWIAFFTAGTRGFTNVALVPAAGGEVKPASFLANGNANAVAWAPDGTYLLFDTGQRTEVSQLARVDLTLRTPKFREDQFRDLFNEEQAPRRPASPTAPPGDDSPKSDAAKTGPTEAGAKKPVEIVFDNIRQRLSLVPSGLDVGEAFISPDGKTAVLIAGAAGQQNLYSWSLDETAPDRPVAKQLTATAGAKSDVSFTPDSKEVFYLDAGRIQAVALDKREPRAVNVTAELDVDFAKEKTIVFDQAWRLLRDNFFDPAFNGVDWDAARAEGGAVHRGIAHTRRDAPYRVADDRRAERVAPRDQSAAGRPGRRGRRPPRTRLRSRGVRSVRPPEDHERHRARPDRARVRDPAGRLSARH
ncbi:MAG TPA: hypothetical protein VNC21_15535, partial [Vicinamibacterales bacterium]|nr:hypothetical protein [Vicinamibacterales bacterium]